MPPVSTPWSWLPPWRSPGSYHLIIHTSFTINMEGPNVHPPPRGPGEQPANRWPWAVPLLLGICCPGRPVTPGWAASYLQGARTGKEKERRRKVDAKVTKSINTSSTSCKTKLHPFPRTGGSPPPCGPHRGAFCGVFPSLKQPRHLRTWAGGRPGSRCRGDRLQRGVDWVLVRKVSRGPRQSCLALPSAALPRRQTSWHFFFAE